MFNAGPTPGILPAKLAAPKPTAVDTTGCCPATSATVCIDPNAFVTQSGSCVGVANIPSDSP